MLLAPRKYKYSKMQKRARKNFSYERCSISSNKLQFGSFGISVQENGYITPNQLESMRKLFMASHKYPFRLWLRVSPYIANSAKSSEARMGKGRGKTSSWVLFVRKGQIIFEFDGGRYFQVSKYHLKEVQSKLSLKLKLIR